jgi:hypothetical protein
VIHPLLASTLAGENTPIRPFAQVATMSDPSPSLRAEDRRSRPGFRALIEEMMKQIRAVSRQDDWTQEERERAEADLERIMATVRREALNTEDE